MFSFIWTINPDDPHSGMVKAKELSKLYPKDLNETDLVEKVYQLNSSVGKIMFGLSASISSLELLNKISQNGLQPIYHVLH